MNWKKSQLFFHGPISHKINKIKSKDHFTGEVHMKVQKHKQNSYIVWLAFMPTTFLIFMVVCILWILLLEIRDFHAGNAQKSN